MARQRTLILTGFGYAEYAFAAAAAMRAVGGDSECNGISRRRLPEFLAEEAAARTAPKWKEIYLLGVSLTGDTVTLADALAKLKAKGVKVVWISAIPIHDDVAEAVGDALEVFYQEGSLLEAVGEAFNTDVSQFQALLANAKRVPVQMRPYFDLIAAAEFHYRNYQDTTIYSTAIRYMANGVHPEAWEQKIKDAVRHYDRYGSRELLGKSAAIRTLQGRINRVAVHEYARVLILGESGTGKETVAQQIHTKSPRRNMPFVAFNCASISRELLEDRFFGHEKGAFTGATERTDGLFLMADGGTLFLDEIGEMSADVQALLLRVLEGGRFMRVGGREELKCDVRLVTATNRNLPALVRDGKFRADLYQRLNVVQLRTPSLREHKGDIPVIANAWWRKYHGGRVLNGEQIAALMDYDYPGNVRELINILDRATALEEDDFTLLMREHKEMNAALFPMQNAESRMQNGAVTTVATRHDPPKEEFPDNLEEATRLHVRRVFEKCDRNLTRAAAALDISRNTVRKYF